VKPLSPSRAHILELTSAVFAVFVRYRPAHRLLLYPLYLRHPAAREIPNLSSRVYDNAYKTKYYGRRSLRAASSGRSSRSFTHNVLWKSIIDRRSIDGTVNAFAHGGRRHWRRHARTQSGNTRSLRRVGLVGALCHPLIVLLAPILALAGGAQ